MKSHSSVEVLDDGWRHSPRLLVQDLDVQTYLPRSFRPQRSSAQLGVNRVVHEKIPEKLHDVLTLTSFDSEPWILVRPRHFQANVLNLRNCT